MEEQLLDAIDSSERVKLPKRPVFLSVLCIHTWIGSALLFYICWREYAEASHTAEQLKIIFRAQQDVPGEAEHFFKSLNRQIFHSLVQMTACLSCAAGAIVMWRLRKWGFYVYAAGQLGSLLVSAWMLHATIGGGGLIGMLVFALLFVFPLGFLAMYLANYKHLR
jgi:hypothetical protein